MKGKPFKYYKLHRQMNDQFDCYFQNKFTWTWHDIFVFFKLSKIFTELKKVKNGTWCSSSCIWGQSRKLRYLVKHQMYSTCKRALIHYCFGSVKCCKIKRIVNILTSGQCCKTHPWRLRTLFYVHSLGFPLSADRFGYYT